MREKESECENTVYNEVTVDVKSIFFSIETYVNMICYVTAQNLMRNISSHTFRLVNNGTVPHNTQKKKKNSNVCVYQTQHSVSLSKPAPVRSRHVDMDIERNKNPLVILHIFQLKTDNYFHFVIDCWVRMFLFCYSFCVFESSHMPRMVQSSTNKIQSLWIMNHFDIS